MKSSQKVEPPKPKVDPTKNILSNWSSKKTPGKSGSTRRGRPMSTGDKGKMRQTLCQQLFSICSGNPVVWSKGFGFEWAADLGPEEKVTQLCNQEGVVVVRITQDRKGNVVQASLWSRNN